MTDDPELLVTSSSSTSAAERSADPGAITPGRSCGAKLATPNLRQADPWGNGSWLSPGRRLRPYPRRDVLLESCFLLRRNRALEAVALLQAGPIRCDIRPKVLGKP